MWLESWDELQGAALMLSFGTGAPLGSSAVTVPGLGSACAAPRAVLLRHRSE